MLGRRPQPQGLLEPAPRAVLAPGAEVGDREDDVEVERVGR
ncbi:Uncharacterised protein [Mycobacteroides abscessus]|nr:Uncharacterised protein [Mycobacteroides abscessus]